MTATYPLYCDTCGTQGTPDDAIEIGGPCAHDTCPGTILSTTPAPSTFQEWLTAEIESTGEHVGSSDDEWWEGYLGALETVKTEMERFSS